MKGLVGQSRKPKTNVESKLVPNKRKADLSKDGVYRVGVINYDVPMRKDKVMNANIKAHVLSDEKMIELGFVERPFQWVLSKLISHVKTMEEYLIVEISKESEDVEIYVVDKYTGEMYDYQSQLYDYAYNEYASQIHFSVQKVMMELVEAGVISGYKENDYI